MDASWLNTFLKDTIEIMLERASDWLDIIDAGGLLSFFVILLLVLIAALAVSAMIGHAPGNS